MDGRGRTHGPRGWGGWAGLLALLVLPAGALEAQVTNEELAERRAALMDRVDEDVILALGDRAPPQDYLPFFPNSNFFYLTGFKETDAVLLLVRDGQGHRETLFVNARDPAVETWEGLRVGPERVEERRGLPGRVNDDLAHVVDSLLDAGHSLGLVASYDPDAEILNEHTQMIRLLTGGHPDAQLNTVVGDVRDLRAIKSPAELELIRRTVEITVQAHREIMQKVEPGMNEFELEAVAEYTFRRYGAYRPAFESIVGSGPNSTILHYNENDRFIQDGDIVKVDIGASYRGYAADITRTMPANGVFTDEQRDIYQLVRDAQQAAEDAAAPGISFQQLQQASAIVLAEGLAELGLTEAPDATFDCEGPGGEMGECMQLQLYYMHGLGHGIGLDVHDPWLPGEMTPGTAFTIEPGVYVRPNLLDEVIPDTPRNQEMIEAIRPAFERYREIGVRIEDDYIVTEEGLEWISQAPREIDEIEAFMADAWAGPEPRNADWVEWYRETGRR